MLTAALLGTLLFQGQSAPPAATKQTKAEIQHQKDLQTDVEQGKKFVIEVEKQEKLSENKEYIDRVNRIGQELAAIAQKEQVNVLWGDKRLNRFDYTFKVLKGDDVNAFSIPGGFIYVYEGLVKYAESDDEIAAVLAHEISHASQRHIAWLTKNQNKVQTPALLLILAAIATGNPNAITSAVFVGTNAVQSFTSGWSIEAEKSADHGGFHYLLKSKYNTTGLLTFMERLALEDRTDARRGGVDWGIYRSHPPGKDRAEAVLRDMRENGIPVSRSAVTKRFRAEVKPGKEGVDIWFNNRKLYTFGGSDALQRADDAAIRLNRLFDQEPSLFEISAVDSEVIGRRIKLIEVEAEDAALAKKSKSEVAKAAAQAIKSSLFNYAFNVWGTK